MEKYGQVVFKDSGKQYIVIWSGDDAGFERIDLVEDMSQYSVVDTSTCTAAYYRKTKEAFLGDSDLIRRLLSAKSTASVFKGKMEQTTEIVDGKLVITQSKKDTQLGLEYTLVLENGFRARETFITPSVELQFASFDNTKGIDIAPINLSDYSVYNVMTDRMEVQSGSAEYYSLSYLKAKYDLDHIEDYDLVVVDSMDMAVKRLREWAEAPTKVKAVDLETTGLEWTIYGDDCITGVVLSYSENDGTYYPFRQENFKYNLPISFMQTILDTIRNQPSDVKIIGHNAKVEIQGFWKEDKYYINFSEYAANWAKDHGPNGLTNPELRIDGDSMILSILVNPVIRKGLHSLKNLAFRISGKTFLELDDIFKDKKNVKFNVLPEEIVKYYACPDTMNTIRVWNYLIKKLPPDEMSLFELENKLIYVTAENEFYGMHEDRELLVKSLENEEYKTELLKEKFQKAHNTTKNINSNDVRRDIFYNRLRCPVEVRTKTGKPSTSNEALKRIVELGTLREYDESKTPPSIYDLNKKEIVKGKDLISNRYPSLVILQQYAKSMKELGAFKRIMRKSKRDRVMFGINQCGAESGRRTSDAHQYSDGMKELVIADSKDHYLWSADFKQVELRILAYLAGQQDLIELESDMDVDIHRAILSIITGKPIWAISAKERSKGKSTNFGVVYMMSKYGLAKKNAGPAYNKDDILTAEKSINGFYNGLPHIKKFVADNEKFVRENGYMITAMKRRRFFKDILDPTIPENKKKSMIRSANNFPVQGFGADLLKLCEVLMKDYIREKHWDEKVDCDGVMLPKVRLMLSIHDEVLVSSHKSVPIEEVIIMFKKCMEIDIKGAPPFFAAPAMVNCWFDGKKDAYEIDLRLRDKIIDEWVNHHRSIIHVETYLEDLNRYRSTRLRDYMEDLITKYKTPEEVAEHVRHPELTHTLIAVYIGKKEEFSHEESIQVAVQRYFEARDAGHIDMTGVMQAEVEDKLEDSAYVKEFGELEDYIELDANGEAIIPEHENEDEEDDESTITEKSAIDVKSVERTFCTFMLNDVLIDLSDFKIDDPDAEKINQELAAMSKPSSYYRVVYFIAGRLLQTNLRIEYTPEEIDAVVKKYSKKERMKVC